MKWTVSISKSSNKAKPIIALSPSINLDSPTYIFGDPKEYKKGQLIISHDRFARNEKEVFKMVFDAYEGIYL